MTTAPRTDRHLTADEHRDGQRPAPSRLRAPRTRVDNEPVAMGVSSRMLGGPSLVSGNKSATSEASHWLHDYLISHEGMADSADIKREGRKAGHSPDALGRARKRLGLATRSAGFPRTTAWSLITTASTAMIAATGDTKETLVGQSTQSLQSTGRLLPVSEPMEFVYLDGGLIVPLPAWLLVLEIERAGHGLRVEGDDILIEPGVDMAPNLLAELRRWKPHAIMLLGYVADDSHLRQPQAHLATRTA